MDPKAIYLSKPWLKYYSPGVNEQITIPEYSIPEIFDEITEKYKDKVALIFYGRKITYGELRELTNRFASALADLGVSTGDRVALYLLNCPQYIITYFAALKVGATVTPVSPVYTSQEVRHQLTDSGAQTVVCQDLLYDNVEKTGLALKNVIITGIGEYLPFFKRLLGQSAFGKLSREMRVPTPEIIARGGLIKFQDLMGRYQPRGVQVKLDPTEAIAALPYTGGTTGHPKAAILTHRNMIAALIQAKDFWPIFEEGKETLIAFLPLFHIYGQVVIMLNGLAQGFTLVLFTTPDIEDILNSVERYKVSAFFGVPTLFEYLKEYEKTDRVNWKRMKLIGCGADMLHESTIAGWERRTKTKIAEGYGMTETSAISHGSPLNRTKAGAFGVPIPNVKAAIIDPDTGGFLPPGEVGELILNGPNIMRGYWQRPEENEKVFVEIDGDRWLRTGDMVSMDEEGYFHFFDRKRDLIKYKGYSVFARHVEEVLYGHPQIKAAGVVGVPDPRVGQLIKAYVVLQPDARGKVSEEEIIEFCKGRLAHYKVPKIIEFRGELPKTDVGKVSRRELREEGEEG